MIDQFWTLSRRTALLFWHNKSYLVPDGRVLSILWPVRDALPKSDTVFSLQVYERVEISLVKVYERVGRSVIYFGIYNDLKRLQKDLFYGCDKVAKIIWFCDFFSTLLKSVHCEQLKGMRSSKIGMCKWYHLSREGYILFQKCYIIKGKGLDLGVEPPRIKRIVPPSQYLQGLVCGPLLSHSTIRFRVRWQLEASAVD